MEHKRYLRGEGDQPLRPEPPQRVDGGGEVALRDRRTGEPAGDVDRLAQTVAELEHRQKVAVDRHGAELGVGSEPGGERSSCREDGT